MSTAKNANGFWDPDVETLAVDELLRHQERRLLEQIPRVYERSSFHRVRFDQSGLDPRDVRSLDDVAKLPLTDKDQLRAFRDETGDPFAGTLCTPADELVELHKTTGTTGKPNVFGLTGADRAAVADEYARALFTVGVRAGDRVVFPGCVDWHAYGAPVVIGLIRLGAAPFTLSDAIARHAWATFELLPGADISVIGMAAVEAETQHLEERGVTAKEIFPNLKLAFVTVSLTEAKRRWLESVWGVRVRTIGGSGDQYLAAAACDHSWPYLHFPEDRFLVEVLHPETHAPVAPGEAGELVITNLWAEAFPYLRYRLEDVVSYEAGPCLCGRTFKRLRFLGRYAWSVDVGGRRVFLDDLDEPFWTHPETRGMLYQLVRADRQPQDRLWVRVAVCESAEPSAELRAAVQATVSTSLEMPARVDLIRAGDVQLTTKYQRVISESELEATR